MEKYVIKLNDKVYEVEIEKVAGDAANVIAEKPSQKSSASPAGSGQVIAAPMPGNIVGVSVKVGDIVKSGQVLLILEAMKMENEIVSPVDGKVVSVCVSKGDTANSGDTLIEIA
ncbi:MAG: biotin/lipoyl-binding protein [Bacillota bacterium]|nr:biotin/lipoyl-binding protein [Bacillota bacterium]